VITPGDDTYSGAADAQGVDVRRVWLGIATEVWRREPGRVERVAARLLRSPGLARALVITPSLLWAWLIASIVVVAAGVWATAATGTPFVALLAPPLAASGIAFAYGPGIDPAWELSRSLAVSDRMVLLARALAVFALNALLGIAASLVASASLHASGGAHGSGAFAGAQVVGGVVFGWLVPMTAVCAVALAAACAAGSWVAGLAVGLGAWALAVFGGRAAGGSFATAVTDTAWTIPYLSIALCGGAVVAISLRATRGAR